MLRKSSTICVKSENAKKHEKYPWGMSKDIFWPNFMMIRETV
jgi:hypothetical protein